MGNIKFRLKHPILFRYVKNVYIVPRDVARIYSDSKIVLNINVPEHKGFNQRIFDAMVCKSLLICGKQDESGIDLKDGIDYVMCTDTNSMVTSIDYYLENVNARKNVVESAYNVVMNKYLFINSLEEIFRGKL